MSGNSLGYEFLGSADHLDTYLFLNDFSTDRKSVKFSFVEDI